MIYTKSQLSKSLVFDIETISKTKSLSELSSEEKKIWLYRYHTKFTEQVIKENEKNKASGQLENITGLTEDEVYVKCAPLIPEFAKVCSVSFGLINFDKNGKEEISLSTKASLNEIEILDFVSDILEKMPDLVLSGYNIGSFDIPFLFRRFIINGKKIPAKLNNTGKKPWEITMNDLAIDYKGSSWEMVGLDVFCMALGIESPKNGRINNQNIGKAIYFEDVPMSEVATYCEADTKGTCLGFVKLCS